MPLVISNDYKPVLLSEDIQSFMNGLDIRIFINNVTLTSSTVTAAFTEATDSGMTAQTPVFGSPVLNGSSQGEMTAPSLTYTSNHDTGDYVAWGWYATDPANSDNWVMAQKYPPGFPIVAAGQALVVTPEILLDQMV